MNTKKFVDFIIEVKTMHSNGCCISCLKIGWVMVRIKLYARSGMMF